MQEVRQQRPRPWWPRLLGLAMLGCAIQAAIEGDYPLPRGKEASASSAAPPLYLRPELLQPLGDADSRLPRFAWRWQPPAGATAEAAPTFDLILLDQQMQEVHRVEGIEATGYTATGSLAETLTRADFFYWCVEARHGGQRVRSPLGALVFSR
jgi:hypothetical protein